MTAKPYDARASIAEARRRQQNAELNALMDEVDAEFPTAASVAPVAESEPEEPETSAKDIANAIHVNGRTGGHKPQMKKAARYIDASYR